jgi:hypothetical protein
MLRDGATEVAPTWAQDEQGNSRYREIDRQLRRIASQRAALDAEEARWLREADRQRIWRKLGFSTALEYLEDVYGYAPRTALERLRVAKELGELPDLEAELRSGSLPWSAVRELSRVMTPQNQTAWLACARGKNVHDISRLVAGHRKGADPDDAKDPDLVTRKLVVELTTAQHALLERTRLMFETERGEHVDDAALLEAMCMRALEPAPSSAGKPPRPIHRIVTHRSEDSLRAWREGRGQWVEIAAPDVELAACDAELVSAPAPAEVSMGTERGSASTVATVDIVGQSTGASAATAMSSRPKRVPTNRRPPPTLSIPKATRELVWSREHARCCVPGCRATRNLACHHLEFRSRGGDHDPSNLVLICDGHHKVLHEGLLVIRGRAPDQLTFIRDGKRLVDARCATPADACCATPVDGEHTAQSHAIARHVGAGAANRNRFDDVVKLEHAKQALMQLGFKARAARAAVDAACADLGTDADVSSIVKAALQRRPTAEAEDHDSDRRDPVDLADAKQALRQLGYPRVIADAAVERARAHLGIESDLSTLIKEALRRCGS